ncbi:hypothetical protein [Actinoplanes sp. TFC3]|uniref:hypothetical protein n=1 Tax=Actinoplanes sp. TFC3 TaxID=1710355 RepID=UPI00082C513F|nr:hypothetical protein [Actinoplanes sp. TFC3]
MTAPEPVEPDRPDTGPATAAAPEQPEPAAQGPAAQEKAAGEQEPAGEGRPQGERQEPAGNGREARAREQSAEEAADDKDLAGGLRDFRGGRGGEAAAGEDESWNSRDNPVTEQTHRTWVGGGSAAIGENAIAIQINLPGGKQVIALKYERDARWIKEARETFVKPAEFWAYRETLAACSLLFLRGGRGTGRKRLAEMLLASVAGDNRVAGVEVPQPDVTLAALVNEPGLLRAGHGVILELSTPGTVSGALLATFRSLAERARTHLVILGDRAPAADPELRPYEIVVDPPRPTAVLRRHLMAELDRRQLCKDGCETCDRSCWRTFVDDCLRQEKVIRQLDADPLPASVADLARQLAGWNRTEEDLDRALGGARIRLRQIAASLVRAGSEADANDPQAAPRRQAVQIAYAAFDGFALADVFEVGSLLLQILWIEENGGEATSRIVFDAGIERMLSVPDGEAVVQSDPDEYPRRVRFTDPRMTLQVLDVVWNDFDGVRTPLQFWLDQLVTGNRLGIRVRAAQIAGWLATLDFEEVWRKLIGPWARSANGAERQAAAWAIDIIALADNRSLGRLRGRVRDWVRSTNPYLHDTAARTCGTRYGTAFLGDALADLGRLAARDDLTGSASVAMAMRLLYPRFPEETREALIQWSGDDKPRVRVHASRSLILLADLPAGAPREQWPRLLADLAAGDPMSLVRLWRSALGGPTTQFRAWAALHTWLQYADTDPELQDLVVRLAARVLGDERLARAGRFTIRRWARDCATADRLLSTPWQRGDER